MGFLSAVKMESYKSFNRASTKLLGLCIALPLFYGIGNMRNFHAVSIEGRFSAVAFGSACWGLLGLTGITNILFVILIANYFGKERIDGQIKLILLEICNRKKVIRAKLVNSAYDRIILYYHVCGIYCCLLCMYSRSSAWLYAD